MVAIKQKIALQTLFITTDVKYVKNALDYSDWKVLEENIAILEVFAEATNALSTYKKPTLHQVDEIFYGIQRYLNTFKTSTSKYMVTKIQGYSTKLSDAHWIVQVLHPGIKLAKTDKIYNTKLAELKKQANAIAAKSVVTKSTVASSVTANSAATNSAAANSTAATAANSTAANSATTNSAATTANSAAADSVTTNSIVANSAAATTSNFTSNSTTKNIHTKTAIQKFRQLIGDTINVDQGISQGQLSPDMEVIRYLAASKTDKDDNPVIWWSLNEKKYPILSALARNYFAIPASSVPCEQLFSIAGNTITKTRNSLAPETAQALLCLRSWFQFVKIYKRD
jgi:hypothetical protein